MVEKWVEENNKALNASIWVEFERDYCDHVLSLKSTVYSHLNGKLVSMSNYHPTFVKGMTNVRTSSF